jgi:hypothetical protein
MEDEADFYAPSTARHRQKMSSPYETHVKSLPPVMYLAMHYATLTGRALLKFMDRELRAWQLEPLPKVSSFCSETSSRLTCEQNPTLYLKICVDDLQDEVAWRRGRKKDMPRISLCWQDLCKLVQELHGRVLTRGFQYPHYAHFMTRRIREDILERWDSFVEDHPQPIADLRSEEVRSTEDVQTLVKGLCNGFKD